MTNSEQFELFMSAIRSGSAELFNRYFKDEYLEREDGNRMRPIHHASGRGHKDITKMLIDHHCTIEACDGSNRRPIHLACSAGHAKITKLLLDNSCNIEARDWSNRRPIHYACLAKNTEATQMLIDHHCDIDAPDAFGETPMQIAVKMGNEMLIHILNGPRLLLACKSGDMKNVSSLLNVAAIEYCDEDEKRPIHWACESGNITIVESLIKTKCNINARDKSNLSPLDIAVRNNNQKLKEIITARGLELELEQLEQQISMMGLVCESGCDHKLCSTSFKQKTFDRGSKIGKGSFGEVYKIKGSGIDTVFAMKRIELDNCVEKYIEGNIYKFLPRLKNKRIVKYFGSIQTKKYLCIFMEYFPKGSLEDKILKETTIATNNIKRYIKQILEGLQFLHRNKIIHRDIKPANILLDHENDLKLADFGVSRSLIRTSGKTTRADTLVGTPNFTAPEVLSACDDSPYTVSSDIWSVGATVINMITGKPPYHSIPIYAVINKISSSKKLELPERELMSEEMKSFIEEMLNPDPGKRPTAGQLLQLKLFSQ